MEKPETTQNISFLWNDVATLADSNCSFVVCKSLIRLAKEVPQVKQLDKINVNSITRAIEFSEEGQQVIGGEIAVEILYDTPQQEAAEVALAIPFKGEYFGTWDPSNKPQVVYVDGQSIEGDHVLLETVLTVPNGQMLSRGQEVIGAMHYEQKIDLTDYMPQWQQIIGTQIAYQVTRCQWQEGELLLEGQQHIKLLYAAKKNQGEKVQYHQLTLAFATKIPMADELVLAAEDVLLRYQSLTASLLNERQILLDINCVVETSQGKRPAEETKEEPLEPARQPMPQTAQEVVPLMPKEMVEEESVPAPMMPSAPNRPAVMPPTYQGGGRPPRRPSKKDNLQKYMRHLDRGVRSAHCNRSIPLNQKEMQRAMGSPTVEE